MARDYKSRQDQRPRRRHGSGSCFFWFLTGALLGALGVAVAWMMEGFKEPASDPAEPPQQARQAIPRPRFDYHSILPEMEVVVPDDELADRPPALPPPQPQPTPQPPKLATVAPAAPPAKPPAPPPRRIPAPRPPAPAPAPAKKDGTAYLLQVASFKSPAEAERLKARLALLGMSSSIQQVTINGKDTYHRVRTGPYRGKDAVNKARAKLSSRGLESIAIKLK